MKKILTAFIFCAFASALTAQIGVPDTVGVIDKTDSTFIVFTGEYLPRLDTTVLRLIDQLFDTAGVTNLAFRYIKENEDRQGQSDRIRRESDAVTALYSDINAILVRFTGGGYLANAMQVYGAQYVGDYRAVHPVQGTAFVRLQEGGTAIQIDANGAPVGGGLSGTWQVITDFNGMGRWRLVGFFPGAVLPAGTVFTRIVENRFGAPGVLLTIEKIR